MDASRYRTVFGRNFLECIASFGNAPKPGAILLNATDISTADGLVPGSLERALRPVVVRGDNFGSK